MLGRLVLLAALAAVGMVVFGILEARSDPVRREITIALPSTDQRPKTPVRIALLSDIHVGNAAMPPSRLRQIVAEVNASKPDLIVLAGDFVNGRDPNSSEAKPALLATLGSLQAPLGRFAVLGNHDQWTGPGKVALALRNMGIIPLSNEALPLGEITLVGIDDSFSGHSDVNKAMAAARRVGSIPIALTHNPDVAKQLPPDVPLLLAGHTHCGQVVLPVIGSLAPIFGKLKGDQQYFDPRYMCGMVREDQRTIIVTAGLGSGSIPVRIGAPPDWWLITLTPQKDR